MTALPSPAMSKRPVVFPIRLSEPERDAIKRAAAEAGVDPSVFVRDAALAAAGDPEHDPLEEAERWLREARALVRALRRARRTR